ncbi:hypothetical protein T484DRAFT_1805124 [Baffinella frigidus]|nr:hypothetical protein T484DRAFT_1805124 [Cryptophyta sp. CCMP2293]
MARFSACTLVLVLIFSTIPTVSSFLPSSSPLGLSGHPALARATLPSRGSRVAQGVCVGRVGVGRVVASSNAGETLNPADAAGEAFTVERRRKWALRRQERDPRTED